MAENVTTREMLDAYNQGVKARSKNKFKSSCPYKDGNLNLRCQWIGGWNDRDMELTS